VTIRSFLKLNKLNSITAEMLSAQGPWVDHWGPALRCRCPGLPPPSCCRRTAIDSRLQQRAGWAGGSARLGARRAGLH
jgi:hypothetical protein